jgi:hypothetical protein
MELNERNKLINEILDKYYDLVLDQRKTLEQAYDIVVLQGYDKSLVDLCLIDAANLSIHIQSQIVSMAKRGLSPKQVTQALRLEGYPESLIRSHMELFLEPEE